MGDGRRSRPTCPPRAWTWPWARTARCTCRTTTATARSSSRRSDGSSWSVAKVADAAPPASRLAVGVRLGEPRRADAHRRQLRAHHGRRRRRQRDGLRHVVRRQRRDQVDARLRRRRHLHPDPDPGHARAAPTRRSRSSADGSKVYLSWYGMQNQDLLMGIHGDVSGQAVGGAQPHAASVAAGTPGPRPVAARQEDRCWTRWRRTSPFKNTCLVAPAGKDFSINFDNTDAGTPHNIAISKNSAVLVVHLHRQLVTGPNKTGTTSPKTSGRWPSAPTTSSATSTRPRCSGTPGGRRRASSHTALPGSSRASRRMAR